MNKECIYCGTTFEAKRGDNRYCSKKCQNKATYDRMHKIIPLYKKAIDDKKVVILETTDKNTY